jgi:putative tryptophan/tyrosine transport system substrate-binding protein
MRRREFIAGLWNAAAVAATIWPRRTWAQPAQRVRRIVLVVSGGNDEPVKAFGDALANSGWVAGGDVTIELHTYNGDDGVAHAIAADAAMHPPDVIVCTGTEVTTILHQQIRTIPIVFANMADPVANGIVAGFAHPGGNITGFTSMEYSIGSKWLGLLRDVAPSVVAVMVLHASENRNWRGYLPVIESGAWRLGMTVRVAPAADTDELGRHIESFSRETRAGMIVLPSALTMANLQMIVRLAARHRLPSMYPHGNFVRGGGLVSYGSEYADPWRRAAQYVDLILRGTKPGDLPVQAPTKFELVLNLKAAGALGLSISPSFQLIADEVIE